MALNIGPKIADLPPEEKFRLSIGQHAKNLIIPLQPIASKSGSRLGLQVTFCTSKCDQVGAWSWTEPRAWADKEWDETINPKMQEFKKLTWADIDKQSSGSRHKLHHHQEIFNISPEAQRRWVDLGLEEFDTLFRFRFGGTRRFWGFIVEGHFFSVWWERHHKIAPTAQKN